MVSTNVSFNAFILDELEVANRREITSLTGKCGEGGLNKYFVITLNPTRSEMIFCEVPFEDIKHASVSQET